VKLDYDEMLSNLTDVEVVVEKAFQERRERVKRAEATRLLEIERIERELEME
jgi:hypothetical protein